MSTEFKFEHVYQAPSPRAVIEAYFNPEHLATQDAIGQLGERKIVEEREDDQVRATTWLVRSLRSLPLFVKPFVEGGRLSFRESMTWNKATDQVDATITPQILGGRVGIASTYSLVKVGEGQVRRIYKGTITANVSLLSGKVERGILAEMEKGMPAMTECTQNWLRGRAG